MESKSLYIILIISMLFSCSLTPKYIKQLNAQFELDVQKNTVSIISENEKWGPNGDGYYLARLYFKDSSQVKKLLKQRKFKSLPIKEDLPISEIHRELSYLQNGYYLLEVDESDPRDFKIVTLDSGKNEMIFYYQLY
jgi:hypothetical protein